MAKDMDDAADDTTVINPRHAPWFVRQKRLEPVKLGIREPEVMIGHCKLPTVGSLNHISA
jgi:hypothetical protein